MAGVSLHEKSCPAEIFHGMVATPQRRARRYGYQCSITLISRKSLRRTLLGPTLLIKTGYGALDVLMERRRQGAQCPSRKLCKNGSRGSSHAEGQKDESGDLGFST